jgi:hypothetical protein
MKLAQQPFRLNRIVFHADAPDEFLGADDADAWRQAFGAPDDRGIAACSCTARLLAWDRTVKHPILNRPGLLAQSN